MNDSIVLGVDIGGTHISSALVNVATSEVWSDSFFHREVNAGMDAPKILDAWCDVMKKSLQMVDGEVKVAISIPGPFDYEDGVSLVVEPGKYDALYKVNVKEQVAEQLNIVAGSVKTSNDAACFLLGEMMVGAGQGYDNAIGVTLGTGVGTARYRLGRAEDADLWCSPFAEGIAEDYLSSRWFIHRYPERFGGNITSVQEAAHKAASDSDIKSLFCEFGRNLGKFLAGFVATERPEIIVVGGGIANAHELFFSDARATLKKQGVKIPLHRAKLGHAAALLGAAQSWRKETHKPINKMAQRSSFIKLELKSREKEKVFAEVKKYLKECGLGIVAHDSSRPWGGFFVIDEEQATHFGSLFFPELKLADLKISGKLSPKILLVQPQKRLSWQYHHRRAEIWRIVAGRVGVVTSPTDEESGILEMKNVGDTIRLAQGQRHRLVGLLDWGVVAEIWQHTDASHPSDEDDIVRVQDDFGR